MPFDYTADNGQDTSNAGAGADLNPHPDGKAWSKCCKNTEDGLCCAFVRTQANGARITPSQGTHRAGSYPIKFHSNKLKKASQVPFFCCHRLDGEYHRVCAGWDAVFGNKHIQAQNNSGE